jgi:hypothetical protein
MPLAVLGSSQIILIEDLGSHSDADVDVGLLSC